MSQPIKHRRRYASASYLKSGTTYYGVLLFLLAQICRFIQLFQDAAARKTAGYAPPEDYTAGGIVGKALVILLILCIFILLLRQRQGKTRMPRGNLYLLLNFLLLVWGVIFFVADIVDIIVYPEFILLVDGLCIAVALIAPPVILQLADRSRIDPDDMLLLFLGIGGVGLAIISIIIVAVVLRKSYTFWHLVPELFFRTGCGLMGVSALMKAIRLRNSLPLTEPVPDNRPEFAVDMGTERIEIPMVTCPNCGKRVPVTRSYCPRCGQDVGGLSPE